MARLFVEQSSTAHARDLCTPTSCNKMATKTKILVGDLFNSYEELEAKVTSYRKDNFVQLARRDSRTLDVARKRVPKRVERANSALM